MVQKVAAKLSYGWRLFATAISFFSFGVGGLLLWIAVFPLLSLLPGNSRQKISRGQKTVSYSFYFFIGLMHRLGVMTYDIDGLEKLNRPGQLIIANHPTLVDIVFLISRIKQASCIVKAGLFHNPFMRGPILNAGYISNGDPEQMIADCVAWLRSGGSMIIFPEGTRSIPGQPYHFQRGAAAIALQANAIVTPVTLTCTPSTLTKAERWYQIPERRFHLTMHVGDDIQLHEFTRISPKSVAVRRFTHYQQDYFTQQRELYQHDGK
ncbi:lysophospholipid acyltransferase family protein [Candidatus Methylobacter oryzae]|uniref:1-acyl-sn-glycerol-3-phosphate acyltransferase n=1 Tax=Candidatus Methylobacter oryzae TaxID=2497749 RepID=A0ABY3C7U7_9GAMM|nr:lysophospholipid acyltransferase family protein [Candidatus Methylobacter oryzae]TRW89643.1 1-acyl-sn-glycerol-3-phosphate acyltransferase [Candidatus Methylobacter oryzae]